MSISEERMRDTVDIERYIYTRVIAGIDDNNGTGVVNGQHDRKPVRPDRKVLLAIYTSHSSLNYTPKSLHQQIIEPSSAARLVGLPLSRLRALTGRRPECIH